MRDTNKHIFYITKIITKGYTKLSICTKSKCHEYVGKVIFLFTHRFHRKGLHDDRPSFSLFSESKSCEKSNTMFMKFGMWIDPLCGEYARNVSNIFCRTIIAFDIMITKISEYFSLVLQQLKSPLKSTWYCFCLR